MTSDYPGIGAMIHYLSGGSAEPASKYIGRKITAAKIDDNRLFLDFADGARICISDKGQSCCESRYMTTDDDVQSLVGGNLHHIAAKEAPNLPDDYGEHECVFVEIATDDGGLVTLTNHNEHNGYYGGFGLDISEVTP